MTARPQTPDEWQRFMAIHTRDEGESITDWMARLERIANARPAPEESARLPYREPGSDG